MGFLTKANDIFNRITRSAIVCTMVIIIIASLLNIILRWFNISLMFVDPMVRHLVFACAFLGAIEATERSQNISIDVLKRYFETRGLQKLLVPINRMVFLLSIFVCLWLTKSAYTFVEIEMEYPRELFWGVHTGYAACIIPLGFIGIAIKSVFKLVLNWNGDKEVQAGGMNA